MTVTNTHPLNRPWLKHYESKIPHDIPNANQTLPEMLQQTVKQFPSHTALIFLGATTSYFKLWRNIQRFATALQQSGVQPGDRISLMLPNCPQFVICFYGALLVGAVIVNTSPLYVANELEQQINDSGSETLIILDSLFPRYAEIADQVNIKQVFVTGIQDALPFPKNLLYPIKAKKEGTWVNVPYHQDHIFKLSEILKSPLQEQQWPAQNPDDVALLQYTGGTTGTPKGAMLTHRNLLTNAEQSKAWIAKVEEGTPEITLAAIPFFHVYGMTVCMNLSLLGGSTMVLVPNPRDIKMVLDEIHKNKATLFPAVPTLYNAINIHPDTPKYDLSTIRACISGSAPLLEETAQKFKEITHGANLVEGYGLTEASPTTHVNPIFGEQQEGSIGLPLPSMLAIVVNDQNEIVPNGEKGELWIAGPTIMKGYWNKPEETKKTLIEAYDHTWLRTGDIATMDDEGYFRIVDRKKDLIIASGYNIYPREVEEALTNHPAILEAAVVGLPDAYRGESVHAVVYLNPQGPQTNQEEIKQHCRQYLSAYKIPHSIEIRDTELPKTAALKILRRQVAEESKAKQQAGEL